MLASVPSPVARSAARFALLLFCLVTLFAAKTTWAMNLYSYDLDSLVYMSSDIVEAKLVRNYKQYNVDMAEIKVSAVHKGAFKPNQSIAVAALNFYRIPDEKMHLNSNPLQVGDTFFFFMVRAKATFLYDIPANAVVYWTVPSGLKLIRDNKVIGFSQFLGNPGPYAAQLPECFPKMTYPTTKDYRAQIAASIAKTDAWAPLLKKTATPADVPKLKQLIVERIKNHVNGMRDEIAEDASKQLANLRDPQVLLDLIALDSSYMLRSILAYGLGTPAGRDALLVQIGDDQLPLEKRVVYARVLMDAGAVYNQTFSGIAGSGFTVNGKPEGNNAEYLTRIARLARDNRQQTELCLTLLRSLDFLFRTVNQRKEEAILADLQTAFPVLKSLYDATQSEQVKYQVQVTTSNGSREAYNQLNAPGGPVISILTVPPPGKYSKPTNRSFAFEYEIIVLDKPVDAPSIVFANQESGKTWSVPSQIPFQSQGGSGGRSVTIPENLPQGRYRVYLQFTRDGKVVSTGHYSETTL